MGHSQRMDVQPFKKSSEYLAILEKQSLPQTVAYLRDYENLI
jgi:hypothetical protein